MALEGITVSARPASTAFLILVNMSAIGSVIVISDSAPSETAPGYQLAFRTPGISPLLARLLKQSRQILNFL